MNTLCRILFAAAALVVVVVPTAHAQDQAGKTKGATSKLYLAEAVGESQITTEGRAFSPRQSTAFDAPGTIIETQDKARQSLVYSNGTGMFVDENTRVEVNRFVQEPFRPDRATGNEIEPSISQSDVFVARGQIGICTSQLVSGSTMNYSTPHATVNIRGGKLSVQANENETIVYLLEGDATVRGGSKDIGGTILRPGERAVIRPGLQGQPSSISVGPIDRSEMSGLDEKVSIACNAKKAVSFEMIEKKAAEGLNTVEFDQTPTENTGEISARPTTPATAPTNITVSPARIGPR